MKRLLGRSEFWALACFGAALPWVLAGDAAGFFPFVCLLVAGFFAGLIVMRQLARIPSRRAGLWAHVGVAAALAVFGALFVPRLGDVMGWLRQALPEPAVSFVWALWVPTLTLSGVVWLTLLARATAALPGGPGGRSLQLPAPVWVGTTDGATAEFTAVEMTRRAYLWAVAACAVAVFGAAICVFVAAEPVVSRWSPRVLLLAFGLGLVLPVFLLARATFRGRSRAYSVVFTKGRMRIRVGGDTFTYVFRDIEAFTWCPRGEAARIEVRSRRGDRSLLVGIAKPLAGKRAALPDLSRRVRAELSEAGLEELPRRGPVGTWRYGRPVTGPGA
ncbi:hypothetical protein FB468_2763 [Leucobacter komagatae]|uniref:Uncharacterized protein n=1 Tax=Leucobacter komagatae TaxID=55969 RepID=A0A542Y9D2_9MICO|nr:hypothetical protein [Leucobacter komagatae]TQL44696.1 hypothetical protein FB468_2763 [Leucobacter komagatae]